MPEVGFEPKIPVFERAKTDRDRLASERAKTVHALLDPSATVTG
jgi:hypothetical protein